MLSDHVIARQSFKCEDIRLSENLSWKASIVKKVAEIIV